MTRWARVLGAVAWTAAWGQPAGLVRAPYLQSGTSTSMTVVWRTAASEASVVKYGPSPSSLSGTATGTAGTDHVVKVTGLQPDTEYFYSVGTASTVRAPAAGAEAAQYHFRTSPLKGARRAFRFWVVGDDGTGDSVQAGVVNSMTAYAAALGAPAPELFLHMGDMAYNSGTDSEFTTHHFAPHWTQFRNTVLWPTMGNHEGLSSSGPTQTGPYYASYVLPKAGEAGGVPSGTEAYYAFDYGNVHFVVLDSHDVSRSPTGAMATWLKSDLLAADADWVVVFFHHPPYTDGTHVDTETQLKEMRQNILPILEQGGVDLVLSGHSHIYERSHLIDGIYGTPVSTAGHILDASGGKEDGGVGGYHKPAGQLPHKGTVYVVAGHGGASMGGNASHPVMYFSEKVHGSVLVEVSGDKLELVNVRSSGVVSDRFTFRKDPPPDAGTPGQDGGVTDGGVTADAGAGEQDAGEADGGALDAGEAGGVDGGDGRADAGAAGDGGGGTSADGGADGPEVAAGGCGCAAGSAGAAAWALLAWATVKGRRRTWAE